MKYVLDSSVAFKTLVTEADSAKAIQLYNDYQGGIHEFLAPDVFTVEVAHAITRAERQGRITPAQVRYSLPTF
jgi:predicted nucleic acid-binding protein